ncbi:MAG: DUF5985 family protein [Verrucomicrobiota bacterium]
MAKLVYVLCGATSLGCAFLLLRGYCRLRTPLLFWSSACFVCFALTNVLLYVDLVLVPQHDFLVLRNSITLGGLLMLLYGMIWDTV